MDATCPNPENAWAKPVANPRFLYGHHFVRRDIPGVHAIDWKNPFRPHITIIIAKEVLNGKMKFINAERTTASIMNFYCPNTSPKRPLTNCPIPYVQNNVPVRRPKSDEPIPSP
jgi:hypothetical protein